MRIEPGTIGARPRTRWIAALTALIAVVAGITVPTAAHAADPLLTHSAISAVSSSAQSISVPVGAAFDGDLTTRWGSAWTDNEWILVDLGATATISTVVLRWEAAYGKMFKIQTSASYFGPWTDIYYTLTGTGGVQVLNVQGVGRYVRMLGLQRGTAYGYSLYEFEVYGRYGVFPQVGCTDFNAVLGRSALVSTVQHWTYRSSHLVDGLPTTRWSSEWSDPQWVSIDMESAQPICKVVLNWETAYATSYKLQISNNNVDFTDVYSTTTSTGGKQTITVNTTGRFLRMMGLARVGGYGYSLWEIEAYAGTNP